MSNRAGSEKQRSFSLRKSLQDLPAGIWALGFGSMFMDTSSELMHSLLPAFMASVLGASMVTIGFVEGVAQSTATITKVFSGVLSDYLRKRKTLVVLGYGLAALSKPIFPLATSINWVLAARFMDRFGKGIRGAPRDALVADITPTRLRGGAYGLRQALDSVGAFIGPLLALAFMAILANDIRAVLWVAVIPAFIAVTLLAAAVREPENVGQETGKKSRLSLSDAKRLTLAFWVIVTLGSVFSLARFSEAFLLLRAQDVGLTVGFVPLVMIIMNVVYAAVAYPAGSAADHFDNKTILVWGMGILVLADIVLAFATTYWHVFVGAFFWGLHMGLTQGLLAKLVADTAPADLRGTAFGIYNLVSGIAFLLASVLAGILWVHLGVSYTFFVGAAFAAISATGILLFRPTHRSAS